MEIQYHLDRNTPKYPKEEVTYVNAFTTNLTTETGKWEFYAKVLKQAMFRLCNKLSVKITSIQIDTDVTNYYSCRLTTNKIIDIDNYVFHMIVTANDFEHSISYQFEDEDIELK